MLFVLLALGSLTISHQFDKKNVFPWIVFSIVSTLGVTFGSFSLVWAAVFD
jgi:hypothetical protein